MESSAANYTVAQHVNKFPVFYSTQTFKSPAPVPILSQINPIYTFPPYFLKTHFNITLTPTPMFMNSLFPSGLPTKSVYLLVAFTMRATCHAYFIFLTMFNEEFKLWSSSSRSLLKSRQFILSFWYKNNFWYIRNIMTSGFACNIKYCILQSPPYYASF